MAAILMMSLPELRLVGLALVVFIREVIAIFNPNVFIKFTDFYQSY
jgi:hypothetical protein